MLDKLATIEGTYDVANIFRFKNSSSWINVKNYIYRMSLPQDKMVKTTELNRGFLSFSSIYLIFLSILNYVKSIFNFNSSTLYVGAGSGLFKYNYKTMDSYLPKSLTENNSLLYFLSADLPDKLLEHNKYLKNNNIIVYSYLLAPLKIIFTNILLKFIRLNIPNDLISKLNESGLMITERELLKVHTRFIVSYYLYKILFFFEKISEAYVVSAYSNTELISVLRSKGVIVTELQHGLIGTTHRAYNYNIHSHLLPTPDYIWVYNDFWKQELLNAGYYKLNQIKVTGRLKYSLVDTGLQIKSKPFIVFTGQGMFYDDIILEMQSIDKELSEKGIELVYIPHPTEHGVSLQEFKKRVETLKSVNIENSYTTEQYIYSSIAHMSVYSSCHFDAIHFKDITYVLNIMKDNPIQYYISNYPNKYICLSHMKNILDQH